MSWRSFVLTVALVVSTRSAMAQGALSLNWNAPEGCPDQSMLLARIQELLGQRGNGGRQALRAQGRIERRGPRFYLELAVRSDGVESTRHIESTSCEDVTGAAAVAISLLLTTQPETSDATKPDAGASSSQQGVLKGNSSAAAVPENTVNGKSPGDSAAQMQGEPAQTDQAQRASEQALQVAEPAAPRAEVRPVDERQHPAPASWGFWLRAPQGAIGVGRLRAIGVGAALGVSWPDWSLGVGGTWFQPRTLMSPERAQVGANIQTGVAQVAACRRFSFDVVQLGPCLALGAELGRANGVGPNVEARNARFVVPFGGIGLSAWLPLSSWFGLTFGIQADVHLFQPRLAIDDLGNVTQLGVLRGSAAVATEWIF